MRARNLFDQSVSVQERQTPGDLGRLTTLVLLGRGRAIEQRAQVAVAKAFESPLAPVDDSQQLGLRFLTGVKGTKAPTISTHRTSDTLRPPLRSRILILRT